MGPPPPVPGADGVPEHEVQELLKFKMRYGRPYVLVRWTGLDAAGDTWEPLDNLTNCEDAIAAFEQATGRSLPRPAPPPPTGTAVAPPPIPPTGFTVEAAPPGDLGAALVGRTALYRLSSPVPPTAPAGCFSRRPRRRLGPFGPWPPDPKVEFGRWLVTASAPSHGPGGCDQRTFA